MLLWSGWPFPSRDAATWCGVALVLISFVGRRRRDAAILAALLSALAGAYFAAAGLLRLPEHGPSAGWIYAGAGLAFAALAILWLWRSLSFRRRPDPVLLLAIELTIALVAHWTYDLVSGTGLDSSRYSAETWVTPFAAELPLLALGLAGVGLFVYRSPRASMGRLGLAWPTPWQVTASLLVAVAALGVDGIASRLTALLTPHSYAAIVAISEKTEGQTPLEILLVYAVLAGIAEEILFRGALQPRAGIVITALLFTTIHTQYGLTPTLGGIFVTGLLFGWLRRRMNTTSAIIAHGVTDGLPVVSAAFGVLALIALMVVLGLVAAHADNERWPRLGWLLVGASSSIVVGSIATFYGIDEAAWEIGTLAACALMTIAILAEARGLRSGLYVMSGIAGWAVVAAAVALHPPTIGFAVFAVFVVAPGPGVYAWYKLATAKPGDVLPKVQVTE